MRTEAWIFAITSAFFVVVAPAYWFIAGDPTGTTAFIMAAFLGIMITGYLGFHASKMDARPEDRSDGEVVEGAGELGFFPPYSWWPLWIGLAWAVCTVAIAMTLWWMLLIGGVLLVLALGGWVFEFYRGEFAH